jgi:hypothetical protein
MPCGPVSAQLHVRAVARLFCAALSWALGRGNGGARLSRAQAVGCFAVASYLVCGTFSVMVDVLRVGQVVCSSAGHSIRGSVAYL